MTPDDPPPSPPAPPPSPPAGDPPPAPQRPAEIPEKFWDSEKGEARLLDLAKGYTTLESGRAKMKETLTAEINAERFKGRPAKPEEYKVALADGVADVVLLDKPPGDDFKPEAGKVYAMLRADSPLLKSAAAAAHKYGMPQAEFSALVTEMAREIGFRPPTEDQVKEQRTAVYKQLGERGEERVKHIGQQLAAALGADKAKALDGLVDSAAGVEAIEALLEKSGQARFSAGGAGDQGTSLTREQLLEIMDAPDYSVNPEKQRKVAEGYAKLYPGKRDIANPNAAAPR